MNLIHWLSEMGPLVGTVTFAPYAIPALAAGIAVATERSGKRLSRSRYCLGLVLWVLLPTALYDAGLLIVFHFFFTPDPASTIPALRLTDYFWEIYGLRIVFDTTLTFLAARLLVRRLRDADIAGKLAYLAVVPFLRFLVCLAPTLYPPSRHAKPIPGEVS